MKISVKDLFCHTWVTAATIGAQSTVVEQQLVDQKSIDVLSEPCLEGVRRCQRGHQLNLSNSNFEIYYRVMSSYVENNFCFENNIISIEFFILFKKRYDQQKR